MTLTVKLPEALERDLDVHCKIKKLTKSEVVTRLLEQYLALQAPKQTPYELAVKYKLIGCFASGEHSLGRDHSRIIKEKLRAKQRAR
ncbi:MAG: hypothetical protein A3G24_06590 [Betaproteobacteria bacterium RIFCSPLOWO2_12_FULL_62_13]|nr:MAG: hypothetical protein A3G24_06590 [Betaproteobacteria bacterium RIFCSPLOWO2_12_FULL_62_13]